MAYNMVKFLLEMLKSYENTSTFTRGEVKAIDLALLDATSAFTNVITDSKSIKREVDSKRSEVEEEFKDVMLDIPLSTELFKVIVKHGHPVYLEEFLDKKEQEIRLQK